MFVAYGRHVGVFITNRLTAEYLAGTRDSFFPGYDSTSVWIVPGTVTEDDEDGSKRRSTNPYLWS